MKKTLILTFLVAALAVTSADVIAQSPDFLQPAEDKVNELITLLTGTVAKLLLTLVLVMTGIAWYFNRLDKAQAIRYGGATALILVAQNLVGWLFG